MTRRLIALVGVSGVGKSFLLSGLRDEVPFQRLSASDLIQQQRAYEGTQVHKDALRSVAIDDNQKLLVAGYRRTVEAVDGLLVLDGHTLIDTPTGFVEAGDEVFRQLEVEQFVFLSARPEEILARREKDEKRERPVRTVTQISDYQDAALISAFKVAMALGVPLSVETQESRNRIRDLLARASGDS